MQSRKILWFEFEVRKRRERSTVSIPADSYVDALNKIKRIHPGSMISLLRKWVEEDSMPKPNFQPPPPKPKAQKATEEKAAAPPPPQEKAAPYWEVLGVDKTASLAEIKKAYTKRVKEYHPDRVADLGEELKALAEKKTFEILKAFNEAKRVLK